MNNTEDNQEAYEELMMYREDVLALDDFEDIDNDNIVLRRQEEFTLRCYHQFKRLLGDTTFVAMMLDGVVPYVFEVFVRERQTYEDPVDMPIFGRILEHTYESLVESCLRSSEYHEFMNTSTFEVYHTFDDFIRERVDEYLKNENLDTCNGVAAAA